MMGEKSRKAKESAEKRWKNPVNDANAMRTQCERNANALESDANAMQLKEIKLKEIKLKEIKENTRDAEVINEIQVLEPGSVVSDMFVSIRNSFQSKTPLWSNPTKEVDALKTLERLFNRDGLKAEKALTEFYNLTKSPDKFWSRQPFLPSRMVSLFGDITTRTEKESENRNNLDEIFG